MQFQELQLIDPLLRSLRTEGYTEPTPIQAQAIPLVLRNKDLIACAQTGTGKTAAFALPILQRLNAVQRKQRGIRAVILSPTRELAIQIGDSFKAYGRHLPFRHTVIYGGVRQNAQVEALRRGVDILVATPGRLLDLMNQKFVRLDSVEIFVLDEADRMLDMGFIHDVHKVVDHLPSERQTLMFSATMPKPIQKLAEEILTHPMYVEVTPPATTVERIDQSVFFVEKNGKFPLLAHLLQDASIQRVLVFTRTKHRASKLARQLEQSRIRAEAIHGDKSQTARIQALNNFKSGRTRVLVATDIAARGIDVDDVTHVINFDLPNEPDSYVHRIGRTARAGASGVAYSFCDVDERKYLQDIEKLIRLKVTVVEDHPYLSEVPLSAPVTKPKPKQNQHQNNAPQSQNQNNRQRRFRGQRRNGSAVNKGAREGSLVGI